MSMRGPELWMRAGWCSDTPVQKLWGLTAWLNSASVTGMVALSSPGERRSPEAFLGHRLWDLDFCLFLMLAKGLGGGQGLPGSGVGAAGVKAGLGAQLGYMGWTWIWGWLGGGV